jgi:hypothetical protein
MAGKMTVWLTSVNRGGGRGGENFISKAEKVIESIPRMVNRIQPIFTLFSNSSVRKNWRLGAQANPVSMMSR